ncbi:hypothetical protein WCLP8_1660007 [uncultured Gammaproteobacteria bacterium]
MFVVVILLELMMILGTTADHGLSVDNYRAKWNLPTEYPAVAPNYAKQRSEMTKPSATGALHWAHQESKNPWWGFNRQNPWLPKDLRVSVSRPHSTKKTYYLDGGLIIQHNYTTLTSIISRPSTSMT